MSVENGVITIPVNTSDISRTLGVPSNDVGTLCKSDNINMWSATKPVKNGSLGVPVDANDTAAQKLTKIKAGNFAIMREAGFGIKNSNSTTNTVSNIKTIMDNSSDHLNGWSYDKSVTWARMGDFVGYLHSALPPITNITCTARVTNNVNQNGSKCTVNFSSVIGDSERDAYGRSLRLSELKTTDGTFLSAWYPCIYAHLSTDTTKFRVMTSDKTFAEAQTVSIATHDWGLGTWYVYLCACKTAITSPLTQANTLYRYVALPCVQRLETLVSSTSYSFLLSSLKNDSMMPTVGVSTSIAVSNLTTGAPVDKGTEVTVTNYSGSRTCEADRNEAYIIKGPVSAPIKISDSVKINNGSQFILTANGDTKIYIPTITLYEPLPGDARFYLSIDSGAIITEIGVPFRLQQQIL